MRIFAIAFCLVIGFSSICVGFETNLESTTFKVEAEPSQGFIYPYYLHIPPNLKDKKAQNRKHSLLVIPNNSGSIHDDLSFHESKVKFKIFQAAIVFNRLNVPVLMPVFPRPKSDWKIYTHALDRDSLITDKKKFGRFDLQLLAMIEHAKMKLKNLKITSDDRVLMYGFSASGMFVNRFAFLHPDIVKAVAIGSPGGWAIAPLKNYMGEQLNYPIGVGDLDKVSGKKFNLEKLRSVQFFMFLGEKDENDSVVYRDGYEEKDEKLIFKLFGKTPVSRWEISKNLYKKVNLKAKFRLYPNVAHKVTREMRKDILSFLLKHRT